MQACWQWKIDRNAVTIAHYLYQMRSDNEEKYKTAKEKIATAVKEEDEKETVNVNNLQL